MGVTGERRSLGVSLRPPRPASISQRYVGLLLALKDDPEPFLSCRNSVAFRWSLGQESAETYFPFLFRLDLNSDAEVLGAGQR